MKFKINKLQFKGLESFFDKKTDDFAEIELEPVVDTASQAIFQQALQQEYFHKGYHHGYREGFYEARKKDYCKCGCGGNNCNLRHCDENCWMYNK